MMHVQLNRRELLLTTGALVVYGTGLVLATDAAAQTAATASPVGPDPTLLDTWISIAPSGLVTVNSGKMDCGQGLGPGLCANSGGRARCGS